MFCSYSLPRLISVIYFCFCCFGLCIDIGTDDTLQRHLGSQYGNIVFCFEMRESVGPCSGRSSNLFSGGVFIRV